MSFNSFWTDVAALRMQETKIGSISDNIANATTPGFRKSDIQFESFLGSFNQFDTVSNGVTGFSRTVFDTTGGLRNTNNDLNLAIKGKGFFVANSKADGSGETLFRRNGNFVIAAENNRSYITSLDGTFLQGWPVDQNGNFSTGASTENIQFDNINSISPSLETTQIGLIDIIPGDAENNTAFRNSTTVYDSQGNPHSVTFEWQKTATPLNWTLNITSDDAAPTTIASQSVTFDQSGNISGTSSVNISANWTNGTPASAISINFGNVIQSGQAFIAKPIDNNGRPEGPIKGVFFNNEGFFSAEFQNGDIVNLYKVPLATFNNEQGLEYAGLDNYKITGDTGTPVLRDPATSSFGSLEVGSIEQSNVDIAEEFSKLIVTQKAYSSAATSLQIAIEMLVEARDMLS